MMDSATYTQGTIQFLARPLVGGQRTFSLDFLLGVFSMNLGFLGDVLRFLQAAPTLIPYCRLNARGETTPFSFLGSVS
jgi:hypothetical protein